MNSEKKTIVSNNAFTNGYDSIFNKSKTISLHECMHVTCRILKQTNAFHFIQTSFLEENTCLWVPWILTVEINYLYLDIFENTLWNACTRKKSIFQKRDNILCRHFYAHMYMKSENIHEVRKHAHNNSQENISVRSKNYLRTQVLECPNMITIEYSYSVSYIDKRTLLRIQLLLHEL